MTDPIVSEMHSVSTVDSKLADVKIHVDVKQISYKFVRAVEDEIYKFVGNLTKLGSVPEKAADIPASIPYNEEETRVIQGSTRETVWDDYQRAFPGSKRTKRGVETKFKNWKRFQQVKDMKKKPAEKEPAKEPITMISIADLTGWQRKFILKHRSDEKLTKKFNKKWPGVNLTSEMIERVVEEGLPVKKVKKIPEKKEVTPAVLPGDGVTKNRFKAGDKVTQISGLAPAHGVGVVQSISKNDVITVKFIGSTKVLHADNFALAATEGGDTTHAEDSH